MELRFVTPELARLDEIDTEVLACSVWSDARPSHGVAGLCDWRLGGRLSDLERRGLVTGELGEVVLLAGKPRLSFDKVLVFGAGPRASFGEEAFHTLVLSMLACWSLNVSTAARLAGSTTTIIMLVPHTGSVGWMMFSRVTEVGWGVAVGLSVVWTVTWIEAKIRGRTGS